MEHESCRICGGDGRVGNAFGGSETTCPACRGTGRRSIDPLFHDVTKTKSSHHRATNTAVAPAKVTWPSTVEGAALGNEVQGCGLSEEAKTKLIREIIEYELSHGKCTKTFTRKIRKQIRPSVA